MIDINNNPPRFFNEDTQKLIENESEAFLYCETCQDTNFGEIVEGKISKVQFSVRFFYRNVIFEFLQRKFGEYC